ncbi:MAG: endolytic transglycosylase MltG [Deltaproteobacteria bacterium]|nr:endolytic transglycosylase MltG [Deltaproteobacteria bacterium]
MKRAFLFVFILLLAGAGLASLRFYLYCVTPHRPHQPATVEVTIPEGASFRKAAAILERQGVITDPLLFVLLAKIKKAEYSIKAGQYSINLPVTPFDIIDKLVRGEVTLISVTIPEGSNLFDIARILEQAGLKPSAEVLRTATDGEFARSMGLADNGTMEGFLFPDTYKFCRSMPLDQMLGRMAVRFRDIFARELQAEAGPGMLAPRQLVVLASLVEKEAADPSERSVIAGVFYNRLKLGMRLECDPTVAYGVRLEDPSFKGRLRKKHLLAANSYNTYQIKGLPAGPICNPGLASLRAVLKPASVDYLFFVSRNNGTHQFSRTLEEHNRAVNQYQR